MKTSAWLVPLALLLVGCGNNQGRSDIRLRPFDHAYAGYSRVLRMFVIDGRVDYAALKQNRADLDSLVADIAAADLSAATEPQRLAFYINAYNALTLRSVIDAYPISSIKEIDNVWDKKWPVAGEAISLNDIEHEVLRQEFHEPRLHVAINCASNGCPPMSHRPYRADSLEAQLDRIARMFARSEKHNRFDLENGSADISEIFDWFGEDFIPFYYDEETLTHLSKKENASVNFLLAHLPADRARALAQTRLTVSYLEYDWSLNDVE